VDLSYNTPSLFPTPKAVFNLVLKAKTEVSPHFLKANYYFSFKILKSFKETAVH
jgi:hypothetical protein